MLFFTAKPHLPEHVQIPHMLRIDLYRYILEPKLEKSAVQHPQRGIGRSTGEIVVQLAKQQIEVRRFTLPAVLLQPGKPTGVS